LLEPLYTKVPNNIFKSMLHCLPLWARHFFDDSLTTNLSLSAYSDRRISSAREIHLV
jgi:hypothetical protein